MVQCPLKYAQSRRHSGGRRGGKRLLKVGGGAKFKTKDKSCCLQKSRLFNRRAGMSIGGLGPPWPFIDAGPEYAPDSTTSVS